MHDKYKKYSLKQEQHKFSLFQIIFYQKMQNFKKITNSKINYYSKKFFFLEKYLIIYQCTGVHLYLDSKKHIVK